MAYEIVKSDGSVVATVEDGSVDIDSTSVNLIGKNFAGYGILQNENFVHLLENFASEQAPRAPVVGQIWYDKSTRTMKYRFDQNTWKEIGSVKVAAAAPTNPVIGDQWWNTSKQQFYIYNGTTWIQIGPLYSAAEGLTGSLPDVIRDIDGLNHVVIKFYVNGTVTAIWSKDENPFIVATNDRISGFYTGENQQIVKPGLTFADLGNYSVENYTNIEKNMIWGTAENALNLNNVSSANYLRIDSASTEQAINKPVTFNQPLTVDNDILAERNAVSNIGSATNQFNVIHANLFVGNVQGTIIGIAEQVRNLDNFTTDDLPEGQTNLYFTANRSDQVRNWNNLTNKPVLVSNVRLDTNSSALIVDKTDNTSVSLDGLVGYTGSAGVGYTGSAGVGYTGSSGSGIDYSTVDRTSIGTYALLASPWIARSSLNTYVPTSGTIITGYTFVGSFIRANDLTFNDVNAFDKVISIIAPGGNNTFVYLRKTYHFNSMIKGPTLAPGSWKIINGSVGTTDIEFDGSGVMQQPANTGIYNILLAIRIA